ncbi:asparaginase [Pseudomonas sp. RIT-PI-S]|uniref:asparaginase n=1 Tax=Pseudomonas sp. RIT-PI-S TaxID=3035295 RepID=UPI0021DA37FB|nr:asparaginase [Pseudomonas sp. RIT-PI-S]
MTAAPPARHIRVLYTGGTIGMQATAAGLAPAGGFEQRMQAQLKASGLRTAAWSFEEMQPLIDSANMSPAYWQQLRNAIGRAVDVDSCDAVLVLHGTDTLAYSAAALSFQLIGLPAPVVFTGSMLPAGVEHSDAWENLEGALSTLSAGLAPGVWLHFHGQLMLPTRCAKVRSSGRNAFAPLQRDKAQASAVTLPPQLHYQQPKALARVAALPLVPGFDPAWLTVLVASGVQGLVLECYGSGTGPSDDPAFLEALRQARSQGVVVVAVTQCQQGGVELDVYEAGSRLRSAGVVAGGGMTREAALGKLHGLLGIGLAAEDIARLLAVDLCGELTGRPWPL